MSKISMEILTGLKKKGLILSYLYRGPRKVILPSIKHVLV